MYVPHICLIKCPKNTYKHLRHPKWHTYTSGDKNGDVELTIRVTATKCTVFKNFLKKQNKINTNRSTTVTFQFYNTNQTSDIRLSRFRGP